MAAPEPGSTPAAIGSDPGDLDDLVGLIGELQRQIERWDRRLDPAVAGDSPAAGENRAIRGAQASLARARAVEARAPLADLRRQAVALRERNDRMRACLGPSPVPREQRDPARPVEVAATLARELMQGETLEDLLDRIVTTALRIFPHVSRIGVSLTCPGGGIESRAASDSVVRELDRIQAALGEGPAWDAARAQGRVLVPELEDTRERWRRFAPAALERGVHSVAALPLVGPHGSAGALTGYADAPWRSARTPSTSRRCTPHTSRSPCTVSDGVPTTTVAARTGNPPIRRGTGGWPGGETTTMASTAGWSA